MLSKIHKRAVGSSLTIVERKVDELLQILQRSPEAEAATYDVDVRLTDSEVRTLRKRLLPLKAKIAEVQAHFGLRRDVIPFRQVLQASYAKMWEVLSDTRSEKLRGFGEFADAENPDELDAHVEELLALIEELNPNK